jgi:hypothetical protein
MSGKQNKGIKMVTDNPSYRTTDIFNTKQNTERLEISDKKKFIEVNEKFIDDKIRVNIELIRRTFLHTFSAIRTQNSSQCIFSPRSM